MCVLCAMTRVHACYRCFIRVPWPYDTCAMTPHICDMTHPHMHHDSCICVPWRIYTCAMTHSYVRWIRGATHAHVWQVWFTCATWLIHMCDMTHSHVRHDSFICATWLNTYMCHDPFIGAMSSWRDACSCTTCLIYVFFYALFISE